MPGLAGRRALVKVTGNPVAFADEATTKLVANTVYQITNAVKRIWDPTVAIVVKKDAVIQSATLYTLNRLTGKITFLADIGGAPVVTVSGSYLPVAVAAGARAYSYEILASVVDDTDFDSANTNSGFPTKLQSILDFHGTIGQKWRTEGQYFRDALLLITPNNPVVIQLFADRNQPAELQAWGLLDKVGVQAVVTGGVDVDVDFQGTPDADGRVVSLP
jgi:hypothetical protein